VRVELIDTYGNHSAIVNDDTFAVTQWLQEQLHKLDQTMYGTWTLRMQPTTTREEKLMVHFAGLINGLPVNGHGLREFIATLEQVSPRKVNEMGYARWCDYADHAYKAPDNPDDINQVRFGGNAKEICEACAAEIGLNDEYTAGPDPQTRHAQIEGARESRH